MPLAVGRLAPGQPGEHRSRPEWKGCRQHCTRIGQGGSVVARIGDQQEQVMDVAIGLFQVLTAQ